MPRSLSNFTIGTFNVRGLSSAIKRDQLSEDLNGLHIDVCCIQETKCPSGFDVISGYYRLIGLPSTSRHYGLALALASYLAGGLLRYWSVSDRLAVIQLTLGTHSTLTIIDAYGPTSQVTLRNQDTQDDFYAALDSITTRYSSSALILIAGDFNSKLGKKNPKRTLDRRVFMWHQEHEWLSARWLSWNAPLVCLQHRFSTRYTSQDDVARSIPRCDEREHCTHLQHYRLCHLSSISQKPTNRLPGLRWHSTR